MCGDFDEQERLDEELFERFLDRAKGIGVRVGARREQVPSRLCSESARAEYMQELFAAALTHCVSDASGLPQGERMDALAGQAIVFARLAGFLAAQFPPEADRFRTVIGARMERVQRSLRAVVAGRRPADQEDSAEMTSSITGLRHGKGP